MKYNNPEYRNDEFAKVALQPMLDVVASCHLGESLDRLEKECCVLQEQLHLFREKVQPLLKPFSDSSEQSYDEKPCKIQIMSERTSHILVITNRVRDMQKFVDLLSRDIDV